MHKNDAKKQCTYTKYDKVLAIQVSIGYTRSVNNTQKCALKTCINAKIEK